MEIMTAAQRKKGQTAALLANLGGSINGYIVQGTVMMLYANDVLGYQPKDISRILAIVPLLSLLRILLLRPIQRFGKVNTLRVADAFRLIVVLAIFLLPAQQLSFYLYLGLLLVFAGADQLAGGSVWQPLLRVITSEEDRGRFFARMRFWFTSINMGVNAVIPWLIGYAITEHQYKMLLVIPMLFLGNHFFWVGKISDVPQNSSNAPAAGASLKEFWHVLRTSALLRGPLAISILFQACAFPLITVYLRQVLHIPANLISFYNFVAMFGSAISFLIWGKIADALGFRPMLAGLLIMAILVSPLLLLATPLPEQALLQDYTIEMYVSLAFLFLYGFLSGGIGSGVGIATSSIEHFHVDQQTALIAMNIFSAGNVLTSSVVMYVSGWFLEDVVMPTPGLILSKGLIHIDLMKIFLIAGVGLLRIVIIALTMRLPNLKPWFRLADFFNSLTPSAFQAMLAHRLVHHEDEDVRIATARDFGRNTTPMSIQPLFDMLDDPSYDVKIEAIRSLALTKSDAAGKHLLHLLPDKEIMALTDQIAWALGELRYRPAVESLMVMLRDETILFRIRAMAARSLGKIGDKRAIPALVEVARSTAPERQHLISSACLALLQLDGQDHAELIFRHVATLTQRIERYEIMNALCEPLGISNFWLLKHIQSGGSHKALLEYAEHQSAGWQQQKQAMIEAIRAKDVSAVRHLTEQLMTQKPHRQNTMVRGMWGYVKHAQAWDGAVLMTAAWCLLA